MHVPVFLIRQVLVKVTSVLTGVLSGMVTSMTKVALFVQPGTLVGMGVSGVMVIVGEVVGVSVDVGDSVLGLGVVSVMTGVAASSGDFPPQAERMMAVREATMNTLLIILDLLCCKMV